jgi:hypothetical protein
MAERTPEEPGKKAHRPETQPGVSASVAVVAAAAGCTTKFERPKLVWPSLPLRAFTYFTDRYFDQFLLRDVRGIPGNNLRLLRHSNSLVVICLDPSHALVTAAAADPAAPASTPVLTFDVKRGRGSGDETRDRRGDVDKITGKGKKQAPFMQAETVLVALGPAASAPNKPAAEGTDPLDVVGATGSPSSAAEGTASAPFYQEFNRRYPYRVPVCIPCSLLEVNGDLADDPGLLVRAPLTAGYVAVVIPKRDVKWDSFELIRRSLAHANDLQMAEAD